MVVPRFAVNPARSNVPAATVMFPTLFVVELSAGKLAANDFVPLPLIRNVL